jgi:hypothetical protein
VAVTCQIFTNAATNYAVTQPQTVAGTTNWLVAVANYLPTGSYTIQALATDQHSNNSVISESFNFTADTNLPAVAITSPSSNALLYLGQPMLFQGTASDSVLPLASVSCILVPVSNADGTIPYYGQIFTNTAVGTTNWSLDWETVPNTTANPGTILPGWKRQPGGQRPTHAQRHSYRWRGDRRPYKRHECFEQCDWLSPGIRRRL